ncbi:LacI family DNA-binding transcriptional regulator [Schaalia naturae]|uniref:LacI family DNA-binding transcriptional regulator n=1 Tax=Schaalia naturae TaxID=635203 RepID=A0ABW2SPF6_9ACTO
MRAHRVTMQDVADLAKVSKSTVSLAFRDSKRLSEDTVRSVMDAARELGYSQDPAARMLRTRRTDSLGMLLPQQLDKVLENPYYTMFLQGVGQVCQREGYTLLLVPPLRGSIIKAIPYAAVDGFIVSGLEADRGEVTALKQRGIPFVLVDSDPIAGVSSIDLEERDSVKDLVARLLDLGHTRIAFVAIETGADNGYRSWRGPVHRRMEGALDALAARGLDLESEGVSLVEVPCTRAGGAQAFRSLWADGPRPTAMVAFSDIIALGILDAAREAGVSVPGELSVTGFDDLSEAVWAGPSLTTIRQPIVTKGRLAAEFLVEAINADDAPPKQERLATVTLLRGSIGPAPAV